MTFTGSLRLGFCAVTRSHTVISLGWNIWGVDRANGTYCVVHLYPFRIFRSR